MPLISKIGENSVLGKILTIISKSRLRLQKTTYDPSKRISNLGIVENDDVDAMYFLHIPKTAGTSLLNILDDKFDYDLICDRHDWGELLEKIPSNFSNAKLFRGHFCYGFYHQFKKKPLYLTMLRDPIKQIPSHYEQSRRNYRNRFNKEPAKDSLLDYLNHPRRSLVAKNMQTRHIAVDLDAISLIKKMNYEEFGFFYRFNHSQFKIPDQRPAALLNDAKTNLESFTFFGITERFEESIQLLCYTFGWNVLKDIPQLNITPNKNKQKLSDAELVAVKNVTELDQKIYDFACKLFDEKYSQMITNLKKEYYDKEKHSELNEADLIYKLLELHYKHNFWKNKPKFKKINYDFSQALMGSGWHSREREFVTHKFFRWTGPETISSIDLPLNSSHNVVIEFQISTSMTAEMIDSLKFKVNDSNIIINKTKKYDGKILCQAKVSSSILKNNESFTRLTFQIIETKSPKDLNSDSEDTRKLGLAFEWIKIFPQTK